MSSIHLFGIRHHGPGCARSLLQALETLQPDRILIEGPPDADRILPLAVHRDLQPPVALLVYRRDRPQDSVYYPFAEFSPEWQAMRYGLERGIPVQFMDLPQTHRLGVEWPQSPLEGMELDPLGELAAAAGYEDGERWWDAMVEQRRDSTDLFAGILEAMTALREELVVEGGQDSLSPKEAAREAYMRQRLRQAAREGKRIAVVCGAWHVPALAQMPPAEDDAALLADLPTHPTQATWVPWSYGRLAAQRGYSAGIESPGWYHHLWEASGASGAKSSPNSLISDTSQITIGWLTRVARLLRQEDFEASSAQTIEAVRLAEALTALRDRPMPGLAELNEATQSVFCGGSDIPMQLIRDRLIISDRLGTVPSEIPQTPLMADLQQQQKQLRLKPEPTQRRKTFDLRQPTDLKRSHLLHRLNLLEVPWGRCQQAQGLGTFKEGWQLEWKPEFATTLLEASGWGSTIAEAATDRAGQLTARAMELAELTTLLDRLLLANLPEAIATLTDKLQAEAALTRDVLHLMDALPPLVRVLRYGNVREYDRDAVGAIVDGLVARICIGLPAACAPLSDKAAAGVYPRLRQFDEAIASLPKSGRTDDRLKSWMAVLMKFVGGEGLLAGCSCRLLLDRRVFDADEAVRRMGLALSPASDPARGAAWIEGFLGDSGLFLIHDDRLFGVIDRWVRSLDDDRFLAVVPLLRRQFATFSPAERRQIWQRVCRGSVMPEIEVGFEGDRADAVLPLVGQLLGLSVGGDGKKLH